MCIWQHWLSDDRVPLCNCVPHIVTSHTTPADITRADRKVVAPWHVLEILNKYMPAQPNLKRAWNWDVFVMQASICRVLWNHLVISLSDYERNFQANPHIFPVWMSRRALSCWRSRATWWIVRWAGHSPWAPHHAPLHIRRVQRVVNVFREKCSSAAYPPTLTRTRSQPVSAGSGHWLSIGPIKLRANLISHQRDTLFSYFK